MSRGVLSNGDSSERDGRDNQWRRCLNRKRRKSDRCAAKATEPVYYNSDSKSKENKPLRDMIVNHLLDSISRRNAEENDNCDEKLQRNGKPGTHIAQDEAKMLPTRYFGRKSKTTPSRALKRRYISPPKGSPTPRPPDERGLTTNKPYFLPTRIEDPEPPQHIDVPLWKDKTVSSLYRMEGTENINDPVYERRHHKFELDERRRKRWDLQRLREQRAGERKKQLDIEKKKPSFFPLPRQLEYLNVTEQVPVLAFGHRIPLFQPCDFSLPWKIVPRRGRPSLT